MSIYIKHTHSHIHYDLDLNRIAHALKNDYREMAMTRSNVKSYRYRVGKKQYIVIQIHQTAKGYAETGNVLASNAVNIQIKKQKGRRSSSKR